MSPPDSLSTAPLSAPSGGVPEPAGQVRLEKHPSPERWEEVCAACALLAGDEESPLERGIEGLVGLGRLNPEQALNMQAALQAFRVQLRRLIYSRVDELMQSEGDGHAERVILHLGGAGQPAWITDAHGQEGDLPVTVAGSLERRMTQTEDGGQLWIKPSWKTVGDALLARAQHLDLEGAREAGKAAAAELMNLEELEVRAQVSNGVVLGQTRHLQNKPDYAALVEQLVLQRLGLTSAAQG